MTNVPLRYRLPNPPASFVGRQEEVASVTASLKDTHVTVLVGPGGVGKTALALHTLHKRFPKRVPHCLYLSLPSHQDELELRREIVRALVAASRTEIDWCLVQEHPDALVEVLLDLAEAGPYWLVLDDVDVQEGHADSLLEVLSLYARSSRYLVLARIAPRADLASGRVLEVGGLDEDAALALGRQLGKGLSAAELGEAVRASGGSPWLLRQALTAPPASGSRRASSQAALLEGLSDGARRFALLMSRLELPVPHATLSAASGVPEAVWRGELTARGWLQEGPGGVRLHEVARQGILAGAERVEAEAWASAALELAQSPLSGVRLEGIRLLLEAEAFTEAEGPLDEALGQLLAEGYAPQLWKLLERVPSEWLSGVRLRCAAELGNPTVLRQLTQPLGGSAADRLTWAETLYMRGDLEGAVETLANLRRESSLEEALACAFEAHLLEARLAIAQGRPEAAHRLLGELSPASDEESVRRDALLQSCAPVDPDGDADPAALSLLQTLEQRSVDLPDRARAQVRFEVALAYLRRDALDAASSVLETPPPGDSGDTLALFETRRAIWLQAAVDLARGRLDAAEERLDQLEPFLSSPSLLRAEPQRRAPAEQELGTGPLEDAERLARTAPRARDERFRDPPRVGGGARVLVALIAGLCGLTTTSTAWASRETPRDPSPVLRADWLLLQLVPSPGVALGEPGASLTLRWPVTPLLYSFGTDRRLNRFRWFIAEPLYRHAGSVELFADPFYIGRDRPGWDRWGLNTGVRAHFPWLERGDALSYAFGASLLLLRDEVQPSFEAGLTTLFGGLGVFVHVAPWFDDGYAELSLRVRWF